MCSGAGCPSQPRLFSLASFRRCWVLSCSFLLLSSWPPPSSERASSGGPAARKHWPGQNSGSYRKYFVICEHYFVDSVFKNVFYNKKLCCIVSDCRFLYLEECLGLGDHIGQALGGSQVLAQVPLVWTAQAVLPMIRPAATTQEQDQGLLYCLQIKQQTYWSPVAEEVFRSFT